MPKAKRRKCKVCKKLFTPQHDTCTVTQLMCSCKCAVIYYDQLPKPKGRKAPKLVSKMVGRRSMAEVTFDSVYIEGKKSVLAEYEQDTFKYVVNETKKYTPDWTLTTHSGKLIYIEYKGVLDNATRKKMKLVKEQYPDIDIRFVFQVAANTITKKSKTTYGMWADQWGFPWADNVLPREWLQE